MLLLAVLSACAALSAASDSGSLQSVWTYSTDSPVLASPAFGGGLVYLLASSGAVSALDAASGKPQWTVYLNASGASLSVAPFYTNGVVLITTPAQMFARAFPYSFNNLTGTG
jgi:outer membrane protein assembly factor BamB